LMSFIRYNKPLKKERQMLSYTNVSKMDVKCFIGIDRKPEIMFFCY
jgi:hypothetical protein